MVEYGNDKGMSNDCKVMEVEGRVAASSVLNLGPNLNLSELDPGLVQSSAPGLNRTRSPVQVLVNLVNPVWTGSDPEPEGQQ